MSEGKYKYDDLHEFVRLEPGEACSLKKHFRRGPLKEVIGFYEDADRRFKDPERFYFHRVDTVREKSRKRSKNQKNKQPYGKRALEYAIEQLAALPYWLLSGVVFRRRARAMRGGRILTPHDAVCKRVGNKCYFIGHNANFPGTVWTAEKGRYGVATYVSQFDSKSADGLRRESADASADASADGMPEKVRMLSPQVVETSDDATTTAEKRNSLAVVSGQTVKDRKQVITGGKDFDTAPASLRSQTPGAATVHRRTNLSLTEEKIKTVDEEFRELGILMQDDVADIYYGLSKGTFKARALDKYEHTKELRAASESAIRSLAKQPYEGKKTNALVMRKVMDILAAKAIRVPGGWLPGIKSLEGICRESHCKNPATATSFYCLEHEKK